MEQFRQDVRYGWRTLRKQPGFTAVAVMTLALGIGVNTAMFSIIAAVLLRPLPFPESDRLVEIDSSHRKEAELAEYGVSGPDFRDWRALSRSFTHLGIHYYGEFWLTGQDPAQPARGRYVSADLLPTLGVRPLLGRGLQAEDEKAGGVALLGYDLWQRRFGSETNLLGKAIMVNNERLAIVGVMPPGFNFPSRTELWLPILESKSEMRNRGYRLGEVVGRLKPGVNVAQVQSELDTIARQLEAQFPKENKDWGIRVTSLHSKLIKDIQPVLPIIAGVAIFILLIACANLGNLLLSRSMTRRKELAIRAAVGAQSGRLVRQLMTESLLLSALGGVAGFLAVLWSRGLLAAFVGPHLPRFAVIKIDAPVWGFAMGMVLITGLVCGMVPAWRIWRADFHDMLKAGGQRSEADHTGSWLRSTLVIVQVSLAMVLLIGAGLAIRSIHYLLHPGLGVELRKVLVFDVPLPETRYPGEVQRLAFYEQLLSRLKAWPSVESAAAATFIAFGNGMRSGIVLADKPDSPEAPIRWTFSCAVSPGFFRTMGVPLLQGRDLMDADRQGAPEVAVINETMARRYWPGENAIGKRFAGGQGKSDGPWITVVGVVQDLRAGGVESSRRAEYYPCCYQHAFIRTVVVRTAVDSSKVAGQIQSLLRDLDKTLPPLELQTLDEFLDDTAAQTRVLGRLLSFLALLALVLAMIGIYGVIAYTVAQRTHEFGVRLALGGQRVDVVLLVLRWGGRLALAGAVMGLGLAWGLTRMMSSLIEGISPTDAGTFLVVSVVLLILALLGCYVPARQATHVDPLIALRSE